MGQKGGGQCLRFTGDLRLADDLPGGIDNADAAEATFASRTICPAVSTTQTLLSSKDTSIPT
jgi:hypothetical protein